VMTTMRVSNEQPAAAVPIVTPVMAAETRTLGPAPRTRIPVAVWIVAGGVVALLVALIIVVSKSGGGGKPVVATGSDDGSGSAAGTAAATMSGVPDAAAPPPDAAPPPPIDAAPPSRPDAAPSSSRRADARPSTKPSSGDCTFDRGAPTSAAITVTVEPWAIVTIDGVGLGQTPVTRKVAPGCHVVKLENDGVDKRETKRVEVEAGQTKTIERDWR
jgi:hypothetical protein